MHDQEEWNKLFFNFIFIFYSIIMNEEYKKNDNSMLLL